MQIEHNGELILAHVDKGIISKEALLKCLYWYNDRFEIEISEEEKTFEVRLVPQEEDGHSQIVNDHFVAKLQRDLLDFELRQVVVRETQNVRDLIIAKAFAHFEDQKPEGEISDPVGFEIEQPS
jgi:His-Xaa-Ser system protein HxsD